MSKLNRFSCRITQPKCQGASQAMLMATGLKPEDLSKPQVGVASVWYEGNPCNMHLLGLGHRVKEQLQTEGLVGFQFNTVGVSDAISMGTDGMSFSLQSRDLIADSIETLMGAQWYDALVTLPGCDKNMPGCIIAMGRLNRPSLMLYGGTIASGRTSKGEVINVLDANESYGRYLRGAITEEERLDINFHACPGPGACGGMFTANTMASAIEALGMSLPYSSSNPAVSPEKQQECAEAATAVKALLEKNIRPKDIMTREAFENALTVVMALGGSTNAVLHLIAMARSVGIALTIDDFQRASDKTPLIADLKPSGTYVMEDVHKIGGIPSVMRHLLEEGYLHPDCLTVTGKTVKENLQAAKPLDFNAQKVILPVSKPLQPKAHIKILRGNLAPDGAVAKITGKEGSRFRGPARVFDCEEDMLSAAEKKQIKQGDVVVIRYEGPKGGPGMPEMLTPTSVIVGTGLGKDVALLTDGRFSGGSHGFIIGHICPEAQEGGPIALVRDGDTITIDADTLEIDVDVSDDEMDKRRQQFTPPPYKVERGTLLKYIKNVKSASEGCVTDEW
ncbi:unnamed protein product [Vitrella brassicaformis CCMP3155]|uniref:dihydroxy-acid dehydratase n=1 Tax=Vitrella brassicaformis (strain CCMP3155) TaxID=1169540 RepID=A0A0G4F949_VITBC|nr:unnamed protein product [Vitrella brassicaformis CCMP3155]|eukprot:CEM09132.1 unnamed protein product [Vitrella brassicaformis CCMP3155]